ncbi:MAG: hypothetical protein Kow0029_10060 [Candidatus Rifleibacteriota bacterium]
MPFFMNPMAFYAAVSLVVVAGIYMFRRQSRDVRVSSLMLWNYVKVPAEGGRKPTLPQTPLVLLLELLILSLFIIAAADPRAIIGEATMPLIVILDDSFSMNAGIDKTPREEGLDLLNNEVFSKKLYRISLIRAGVFSEFIGRRDMQPGEAEQLIENWRCNSPDGDIDEALKLAAESFNPGTRILVVTDSKPPSELSENITWYGFGQPMHNLAITAANRYSLGNVDRCFLEFSNFSDNSARLTGKIVDETANRIIENLDMQMAPGSIRRIRFTVKSTKDVIRAEIENDGVLFDNKVWLLPVRKRPVKVSTNLLNGSLKRLIEKTVAASDNAVPESVEPDIIFTMNQPDYVSEPEAWNFEFAVATSPALAHGVVTMDHNHPLCDGLPDVKAAWAIRPEAKITGYPLLSTGDFLLLTIRQSDAGLTKFQMNFCCDYSNLQHTSFWPVLFWNLFSFRQNRFPGPVDYNFRSGMEVAVNTKIGEKEVYVQKPDGKTEKIPVWSGAGSFIADETGLYKIHAQNASWTISVNLVSARESNLIKRERFLPGERQKFAELLKHSSDVRWWFITPAILLLLVHQWLINRRRHQYVC